MKILINKNKNINDYKTWSVWTCGISKFDWEYTQEEHCFIIKGKVKVTTRDSSFNISKGDYVIFPRGLKCHWEVIEPIEKYYDFK